MSEGTQRSQPDPDTATNEPQRDIQSIAANQSQLNLGNRLSTRDTSSRRRISRSAAGRKAQRAINASKLRKASKSNKDSPGEAKKSLKGVSRQKSVQPPKLIEETEQNGTEDSGISHAFSEIQSLVPGTPLTGTARRSSLTGEHISPSSQAQQQSHLHETQLQLSPSPIESQSSNSRMQPRRRRTSSTSYPLLKRPFNFDTEEPESEPDAEPEPEPELELEPELEIEPTLRSEPESESESTLRSQKNQSQQTSTTPSSLRQSISQTMSNSQSVLGRMWNFSKSLFSSPLRTDEDVSVLSSDSLPILASHVENYRENDEINGENNSKIYNRRRKKRNNSVARRRGSIFASSSPILKTKDSSGISTTINTNINRATTSTESGSPTTERVNRIRYSPAASLSMFDNQHKDKNIRDDSPNPNNHLPSLSQSLLANSTLTTLNNQQEPIEALITRSRSKVPLVNKSPIQSDSSQSQNNLSSSPLPLASPNSNKQSTLKRFSLMRDAVKTPGSHVNNQTNGIVLQDDSNVHPPKSFNKGHNNRNTSTNLSVLYGHSLISNLKKSVTPETQSENNDEEEQQQQQLHNQIETATHEKSSEAYVCVQIASNEPLNGDVQEANNDLTKLFDGGQTTPNLKRRNLDLESDVLHDDTLSSPNLLYTTQNNNSQQVAPAESPVQNSTTSSLPPAQDHQLAVNDLSSQRPNTLSNLLSLNSSHVENTDRDFTPTEQALLKLSLARESSSPPSPSSSFFPISSLQPSNPTQTQKRKSGLNKKIGTEGSKSVGSKKRRNNSQQIPTLQSKDSNPSLSKQGEMSTLDETVYHTNNSTNVHVDGTTSKNPALSKTSLLSTSEETIAPNLQNSVVATVDPINNAVSQSGEKSDKQYTSTTLNEPHRSGIILQESTTNDSTLAIPTSLQMLPTTSKHGHHVQTRIIEEARNSPLNTDVLVSTTPNSNLQHSNGSATPQLPLPKIQNKNAKVIEKPKRKRKPTFKPLDEMAPNAKYIDFYNTYVKEVFGTTKASKLWHFDPSKISFEGSFPLESSNPGCVWTPVDKEMFFKLVARHSIHNIDLIASEMKKSEMEIITYYNLLHSEVERLKKGEIDNDDFVIDKRERKRRKKDMKRAIVKYEDMPIAYDMSEWFIRFEDEQSFIIENCLRKQMVNEQIENELNYMDQLTKEILDDESSSGTGMDMDMDMDMGTSVDDDVCERAVENNFSTSPSISESQLVDKLRLSQLLQCKADDDSFVLFGQIVSNLTKRILLNLILLRKSDATKKESSDLLNKIITKSEIRSAVRSLDYRDPDLMFSRRNMILKYRQQMGYKVDEWREEYHQSLHTAPVFTPPSIRDNFVPLKKKKNRDFADEYDNGNVDVYASSNDDLGDISETSVNESDEMQSACYERGLYSLLLDSMEITSLDYKKVAHWEREMKKENKENKERQGPREEKFSKANIVEGVLTSNGETS
ncbi:hypothetical protein PVL30_005222 [Lodderomyces elongisporus]|uniref:uncharacterized protein n=1 Tax=Lodderomyces elongisporus TaxID=36914 RepID=UPI002925577F|nr:uncharacterized protein PVL30_005222 [Lodderomyces elongisporus]WLF81425.1 hypothetical protein PVL30_005222 [Lodderomyces elongisporus]